MRRVERAGIGRGRAASLGLRSARLALLLSIAAAPALARQSTSDSPPAPVAPAVVSRDGEGRVKVRAVRVATPIQLDGRLDEVAYLEIPSISDFVQMEPDEGAPATQKTEFWLLFDQDNLYVTARVWEAYPERMIANEMRHDSLGIFQGNDNITFILDTYHDRRNGLVFVVNPIGGRAEGQVTNERQYNGDFNPLWDVKTGRFEGGWTLEAAVPFKSLRYRPGAPQVWGFNIKRENRWKNESAFLTHMPPALGQRAMMQVSLAATLVGLDVPSGLKNLEVKPYAVSSLTSDRAVTPRVSNDVGSDVGLDVKYGLTASMTADLTYNTDFAQVEADEQQVNLTRFSLFFPEKREFFLENKGTFDFGGQGGFGGGGGDVPTVFYSRRIGLASGRSIPIHGGGRLSGRVGRYSLGMLSIQTDDDPAAGARGTNFTVARLRRDILRRSSVGVLATRRSIREVGAGANEVYGVDGTFGFFDNLSINTYWARTQTAGLAGDDTSYRAQIDYAGDRYGVQVERLKVGDDFNPEVGFLRRDDMRKTYGQLRFSPRPKASKSVRKFSMVASMTHVENGAGLVESRDWDAEFGIEFQNADRVELVYNDTHELLVRPFRVASALTVPVGEYDFASLRGSYTFGPQRRISGTLALERGSFFGGDRTTMSVSSGRVEVTPQFSLQPTLSLNRVSLPQGDFRTNLVGSRVTYTMTPLMFVSALVQYNSSNNSLASNIRLRWEYRPGSEVFVVYNEQRDTLSSSFPDLVNRAVIVKVNRLLRF